MGCWGRSGGNGRASVQVPGCPRRAWGLGKLQGVALKFGALQAGSGKALGELLNKMLARTLASAARSKAGKLLFYLFSFKSSSPHRGLSIRAPSGFEISRPQPIPLQPKSLLASKIYLVPRARCPCAGGFYPPNKKVVAQPRHLGAKSIACAVPERPRHGEKC